MLTDNKSLKRAADRLENFYRLVLIDKITPVCSFIIHSTLEEENDLWFNFHKSQ